MDGFFTFPLIPRRRLSGSGIGEYPGQRRGQGKDFIDKRPYQSSDPIRAIDWKETAKRSAQQRSFSPYVRQFRQDEIMRAVIVVDRSPRMALYPSPWLAKPKVIVSAGQMIVDSLKKHHGLIGYLDYADWAEDFGPFWRSPNRETESVRVRNRNLPYEKFTAPEDSISMALEWLFAVKGQVPPESFVFILSDFLVMPGYDLLEAAVARWDVVPVVIQDPTLEASYPVWRGRMPVWIPQVSADGRKGSSFLSAADAAEKREGHQNRLQNITAIFESIALQPVALFSTELEEVYYRFSSWSAMREGRRG